MENSLIGTLLFLGLAMNSQPCDLKLNCGLWGDVG
jgi:hypothetical protein